MAWCLRGFYMDTSQTDKFLHPNSGRSVFGCPAEVTHWKWFRPISLGARRQNTARPWGLRHGARPFPALNLPVLGNAFSFQTAHAMVKATLSSGFDRPKRNVHTAWLPLTSLVLPKSKSRIQKLREWSNFTIGGELVAGGGSSTP